MLCSHHSIIGSLFLIQEGMEALLFSGYTGGYRLDLAYWQGPSSFIKSIWQMFGTIGAISPLRCVSQLYLSKELPSNLVLQPETGPQGWTVPAGC